MAWPIGGERRRLPRRLGRLLSETYAAAPAFADVGSEGGKLQ
jgi:hypothetical protein